MGLEIGDQTVEEGGHPPFLLGQETLQQEQPAGILEGPILAIDGVSHQELKQPVQSPRVPIGLQQQQ